MCPYFREQDAELMPWGSGSHWSPASGPRPPAWLHAESGLREPGGPGLAWAGRCSHLTILHPQCQPLSGLPSPWWPVTRLTGHQAHHGKT